MMTKLLQKLAVTTASTFLSFAAIGASPARALIWNFNFFNDDGRVGRVTFNDRNLTYSSLRFRKIFPVPASGNYKILGNLRSGDFSIKFDVGLTLKVIKQYSYWQLYNAKGELVGESPRSGNGWLSCNDVRLNGSSACVTYYKSVN
ncbi:MAG TPA: hypothetical protein V6D50_08150 [Chroococcales cyanobacterium]|jgi:hypothetical protein